MELIKILRTFSKAEIKELRKFLISPFINKNKSVINVFENLIKYHPEYRSATLEKEKIFKNLYPTEKYNEKRINLLIHYLGKVINNYLAYKNHFKNRFNVQLGIVEEKNSRLANFNFKKDIERLIDFENTSGYSAEDNFYNNFNLNKMLLTLNQKKEWAKGVKNNEGFGMDKLFSSLSSFYLLNFFKLFIIALNRNQIYYNKFDLESLKAEFLKTEKSVTEKDELLKIYYLICELHIKDSDPAIYERIKVIMSDKKDTFHVEDRIFIYNQMRNFCVRLNWKRNPYHKEQFRIIKEQIADKPLLKKIFKPLFYINTIKVALRNEQLKWAHLFIEEHKEFLHESCRKSVYDLGLALYYYEIKDTERSLMQISDTIPDNKLLVYDRKMLETWIYYDLKWNDRLSNHIVSFKQYIKLDKLLSEDRKEMLKIYLIYLFKLLKLRESVGYKRDKKSMLLFEKLSEEIVKNVIISKNWLLERVDDLAREKLLKSELK